MTDPSVTTQSDSVSDQPPPPALSVEDILSYYAMEITAAEEQAQRLERQAAQARGRAEALRAAAEWLRARLSGGTHD